LHPTWTLTVEAARLFGAGKHLLNVCVKFFVFRRQIADVRIPRVGSIVVVVVRFRRARQLLVAVGVQGREGQGVLFLWNSRIASPLRTPALTGASGPARRRVAWAGGPTDPRADAAASSLRPVAGRHVAPKRSLASATGGGGTVSEAVTRSVAPPRREAPHGETAKCGKARPPAGGHGSGFLRHGSGTRLAGSGQRRRSRRAAQQLLLGSAVRDAEKADNLARDSGSFSRFRGRFRC